MMNRPAKESEAERTHSKLAVLRNRLIGARRYHVCGAPDGRQHCASPTDPKFPDSNPLRLSLRAAASTAPGVIQFQPDRSRLVGHDPI